MSLVSSHIHNWNSDPFSRGAYSFTSVDNIEMPRRLSEPVAATLFFAGEATDARGEQGTVHGAIASGKRAAREIFGAVRSVHASGKRTLSGVNR